MKNLPILAITMGDPSGIGPEIILKALSDTKIQDICRPVVIGDFGVFEKTLQDTGTIDCNRQIEKLSDISKLSQSMAGIPILDTSTLDMKTFKYGEVNKENGKAAARAIELAVKLAQEKKVDAMVTAPLQKESLKLAGVPYPGHTEMIQALTKAKHVNLMLMKDNFRVVHATLHTPISRVAAELSIDKILKCIQTANEGCKSLGIAKPKIGVCGLNPHAGENGLFGKEDIDLIKPSVVRAVKEGIDATGPHSSDGIFSQMLGGKFDIVVAMYHDQGGIPMKLLSFEWDNNKSQWKSIRGVNVTLGLPIIRTSVSHGTAFEIAGKGIASPDSLKDAIHVALTLIKGKNNA